MSGANRSFNCPSEVKTETHLYSEVSAKFLTELLISTITGNMFKFVDLGNDLEERKQSHVSNDVNLGDREVQFEVLVNRLPPPRVSLNIRLHIELRRELPDKEESVPDIFIGGTQVFIDL